LLFASKVAKHTKSNTIVLAVEGQLLASGVGQTSRVDALKQAIEKAKSFGFSLQGAVMASDAFFPFPDCVEIAQQQGIQAVIQTRWFSTRSGLCQLLRSAPHDHGGHGHPALQTLMAENG
jgi:AICAR transformylase/IMP cyclohydrolase PurH